ncbi:hypothetical protein [Micromonospora sp. NPDC001898]|uniref:hypothetical protein n=1 Tax=Micromonospora sp. NPDC001898 TaxID=3364221 RepID=UPI003691E446
MAQGTVKDVIPGPSCPAASQSGAYQRTRSTSTLPMTRPRRDVVPVEVTETNTGLGHEGSAVVEHASQDPPVGAEADMGNGQQ